MCIRDRMRTALVQQHFGKRRRDVVIRFHVVAECLESPREISDSQRGRSHVDAAAARAEIHRDTSDSNARQRASWTVVVMFMRPRPVTGRQLNANRPTTGPGRRVAPNLAPFGWTRRTEAVS